ncbi:MAG: aminopeptidase P family N-terminal domain-containing protein [Candidatus Omnitrophica bacterium]|nr:aminopeptidase P family N-terminal domain-containing protein [Candidatus Omnitrophota bacterium]MCM8801715.1 aminopeptidase P family N-terminal domain-containing protein [Candidatus Omnitrophota bacterium]
MEKEILIKWERIKKILDEEKLEGVLLNKVSNFAWFTGGKINYVGLHTETGVCKLLVTKKKIFYLTNNIEYPRISDEELKNFNFEPIIKNWYEEKFDEKIKEITNAKVGSDIFYDNYIPLNIEKLHFPLLREETERYKKIGREISKIVTNICKEIKPGDKEIEICGKLSESLWKRNIVPVVVLIASDERIKRYRHPVPKEKRVKKSVMVVLCARKYGLIVSLSRLIYFGKLPEELKKKHLAVCKIDSVFIGSTCKGRTIGEIFSKGIEMYEKTGYGDEWKKHHQGGPTGYMTRYFRATKERKEIITENQAFAWNPSITGTKSEDTIITTEEKPIIITEDRNWPLLKIETEQGEFLRPNIFVK